SDGWSRLHNAIIGGDTTSANQNRAPWMTLAQVAGVALVAVGLWEFVASPWIAPQPGGQEYTTASEGVSRPTLQVILVRTAAFSDITAFLQEKRGTIIDGPGALSVYRIAFENEEDRDAAHKAFEENTALVETVLSD
ncbi:hypothetical protein N9C96_02155, partial [bacterium]|nr:hypothetical protein [bacterium]